MSFKNFSFGTQVRKSPFSDSALKWGAQGFSVYNHMYIPRDFGDPVQNFWNLVNEAILCDVAVERQVEISGADAAEFSQLLTCRDISKCQVGQCKYVLLTDKDGGIVNDPIMLKLAEDKFWFSIADSDVLLWARGLAAYADLDVKISEPDVSPLQLQGPQSRAIIKAAFGNGPAELKYYRFTWVNWRGVELLISRTGWSSELGYEIFLTDGSRGAELWEYIMEVGAPMGLKPGHTSTIRRIEAAMLSYQADLSIENNPFELGMERLVDLDGEFNFLAKDALQEIRSQGIRRKQVGLVIDGEPIEGSNDYFWELRVADILVGKVTSAIYSPRLSKNIALGIIDLPNDIIGTRGEVEVSGQLREFEVVEKPFFDPKKGLAING
ncbi:MAG: glycine cleavage T C-terminal barrel domain-containing protein [Alphaproteobacteria bacterium]